MKLGFPEPVSRLGIKYSDGSHSFLIGTEFCGAGWLCCWLGLAGPQAAASINKRAHVGVVGGQPHGRSMGL